MHIILARSVIESCVVDVAQGSESYIIFGLYRPHGDFIDEFLLRLTDMLHHARVSGKRTVILGDFNINLLDQDSGRVNRFTAELYSLYFIPVITKPTRFPPSGINSEPSALDHIWINSLQCCSSGVIFTDISDHCPTFIHIPTAVKSPDKIKITLRNHSLENINAYLRRLLLTGIRSLLEIFMRR